MAQIAGLQNHEAEWHQWPKCEDDKEICVGCADSNPFN